MLIRISNINMEIDIFGAEEIMWMPDVVAGEPFDESLDYSSEGGFAMEYTTLGNTDIQISKLVGCMSFGKAGTMHDWTMDETEKVVKHALETLSSSPRCGRH